MNTQKVKDAIEAHNVIPIKADMSIEEVTDDIAELLAELNSKSIPFYAIFPANEPHRPIVLRDVITASQIVEAIKQASLATDSSSPTPSTTTLATPSKGALESPSPPDVPVSNASVTEDKPDENPEQKPAAKTEENGGVPPAP